jgi:hypothetical protein
VQFNSPSLLYLKMIGLGLLGALLVYQLVAAVRAGLGDMYAAPAMLYMLEANDNQLEITPADRQAIEISLNRGLAFAPDTPEYLINLGWLQQYRMAVDEESLDDAEWLRLSTLAYESYAQAAAQRPTWPYDWGDMALEQYRQRRFDGAEYNQALVNVARFGPWKDDSQVIVAELALDTWEYLRPEARQATLATIDRGLRRQPGVMIEIIEAYPGWPTVCSPDEGFSAELPYLQAECQARLAQEPGT